MADELVPLANALKSMKRANSGLTWIRQPHVTHFIRRFAAHGRVSHTDLDGLPPSRTREYVRGLLVAHGALPYRDETKTRYVTWARAALETVTDDDNRVIIERYIRWQHLRRMNDMDRVSQGTFLRSKQSVTVAISFLNWLHQRNVPLAQLQQADLDDWVNGGPSTRLIADRFLNWARKNQLTPTALRIPPHRRGTSRRLSAAEQEAALQEIINGPDLSNRDRAAAILVLVFGQQLQDVVGLTWDDVAVTDELVTITLGSFAIALTDPLDGPWRDLLRNPGHDQTAAHPDSPWVFRGISPGQHLNAASLRTRLQQRIGGTSAARLGTLHELARLAPVAVIAEALGYSAKTIENHATASGADYARYVSAIVDGQ